MTKKSIDEHIMYYGPKQNGGELCPFTDMYYNIMLEAAEGRDESNPFIQAPTPIILYSHNNFEHDHNNAEMKLH